MIFIHDTIYGKVWKVDKKEKYIDLQMTTSEKKQDGEYISSGWFPRAIGHALNTLQNVKSGDKITITKAKITNERYKDKEGKTQSAFKFLILEATIDGDKPSTTEAAAPQQETQEKKETESSDCPW